MSTQKDELCGFSQEISNKCGFLNTPPSLEQWSEETEDHLESIRSKAFLLRGRVGVGSKALRSKYFFKSMRAFLTMGGKKGRQRKHVGQE